MTDDSRTTDRPALMPSDTPDHMAPAWAACMQWALRKEEIRATFEAETGCRYSAPKSAIDRMIDNATGHGDAYVRAFVQWANEHVWGPL